MTPLADSGFYNLTIGIAGETFDGQNLQRRQRGKSRIKRGSVKRSAHPPPSPPPASGTHRHGELYMEMNSNRLIILSFFFLRSTLDNTAVGLGQAGHPYIFPSTSGRPGNDVQERVGQVAVVVEGVVSASQGDVAEIPAEKKRVKNIASRHLLCGYVEEPADYGSRFKSRLMPVELLCQSNLTTNDRCSSRHLLACDTKWIRAFIFLSFFFFLVLCICAKKVT